MSKPEWSTENQFTIWVGLVFPWVVGVFSIAVWVVERIA